MNRVDGRHDLQTSVFSVALLIAAALVATDVQAADEWQSSGDVRFGYAGSETRSRTGVTTDAGSFRTRARMGFRGEFLGAWQASVRAAVLLDTKQQHDEFWFRTYAPGPAGLEGGQATIDEAYVQYRSERSPWSLRLGRFQVAFAPDDLMKKSLDQNNSTNFDINWTDGAWWQWHGSEWNTHVILRHNDRRGPTSTLRPPLDFADSSARAGVFLATESKTAIGPLVQRMLTLTWLPSSLRPHGITHSATDDYLAVTAKAAAEWPWGSDGMRFRLGGEIGYAPDTPRREAMGSGSGDVDADGLSWQASVTLGDIRPDHDVGIVYARIADGWLLSSDFRPNDSLLEARWVWRLHPAWQVDARVRRREEINLPLVADRARRDHDFYVRATWRF